MKKIITIIIAISFLVILSTSITTQGAESTDYSIYIKTENDKITVEESISLTAETDEVLEFWVQNGARDFKLECNDIQLKYIDYNSSTYYYKITTTNVTSEKLINVKLKYNFLSNTENFQKKILFNNTGEISVKFEDKEIYKSRNLKNGSYFDLKLYELEEGPLTWYIIGFIILLIILLGVTSVYSFKKQKPGRKTDESGGSEEFLSTKKALLLSVLKEIEKQHRSKKISDNTYNKLKDQYKQEAVNAMKKLEEIESKVK